MGTINIQGNGQNRVSSIKQVGVNENSAMPAREQQARAVLEQVSSVEKGNNLSVLITNTGADRQNFLLFDVNAIAAAKGANANGAGIVITSTFAGTGTAAGYQCLKNNLTGSRVGSVGTAFQFGDEAYINSANINIWNGNYEDHHCMSLQNYLQLAKDTYANDPKILVMATALWLNNFLAISGSLPAGGELSILFNIPLHSNF